MVKKRGKFVHPPLFSGVMIIEQFWRSKKDRKKVVMEESNELSPGPEVTRSKEQEEEEEVEHHYALCTLMMVIIFFYF